MSHEMRDYPWWGTVEGNSLAQGDLLLAFELPVLTGMTSPGSDTVKGEGRTLNLIIMTQTCDIEHDKVVRRVGLPVDIPKERIAERPAKSAP